jgi:hypothetical protein
MTEKSGPSSDGFVGSIEVGGRINGYAIGSK